MFKRLLSLLLLCIACSAVVRAETPLPPALDLQRSAQLAQQQHAALVVLFSLPDCPWCEQARSAAYAPLVQRGQPVVQVKMDPASQLRDFDGHPTDGRQLAARLHVKLAPTALFVGGDGRELAPRLVGVGTLDYYPALVDAALAQAALQLSR